MTPRATPPHARAVAAGHLCLDITPAMPLRDPIEPGRLIQVGPPRLTVGGAVGNTGLALHRLGIDTRMVGCVGDDALGPILRGELERHGVDLRLLTLADHPTSYSVVISPPDVDRAFLHCPGVNDAFSPGDIVDGMLRGARVLHFGYPPAMKRTFDDGGAALADLFARARRLGLVTVLDTCGVSATGPASRVDWPAWFSRVLPHVDCFMPSHDELGAMLHRPADDKASLHGLARSMLDAGCALVVLKLGSQGLYAAATDDPARLSRIDGAWAGDAGGTWREPCFKVAVTGTTAAGDSTIAGFIAGLVTGESLPGSLRLATAVGAHCVESADAVLGIPPLKAVRERIAAGWTKGELSSKVN